MWMLGTFYIYFCMYSGFRPFTGSGEKVSADDKTNT